MMKYCVAIAAVLAFSACKTVDNEDMAKKVKDSLNDQLKSADAKVAVKSVDCPSGKSMNEGTKFDCTVQFDNGQSAPAHIDIEKDQQFSWTIDPADLQKILGGAEAGSGG